MTFPYKTTPFKHQAETFEATRDVGRFALFWEMGTGKTKVTLDTAAWLFQQGKINGLLVLAPNGVHRNWITDEIPKHLALSPSQYAVFQYNSNKAGTKRFKAAMEDFLSTGADRLAILAMAYDGIMTAIGHVLVSRFLETRTCLYVLDESARIKSPGAKRTKRVLATCKYAPYRRILTGTPVANSPFDVYTQMKFLNLEFWKPHHLDSYTIFKHYFGIWKKLDPEDTSLFAPAYCVAYRNLEELNRLVATASSRVTKDQVLDLPPKLYTKRYFTLNTDQRRVYEELKAEFMAVYKDELLTAPLVIVRLTRFQQITSGYIPSDGGDPVHDLGPDNPRLKALEEILEDIVGTKVIIWAKYVRDIDKIMELATTMGRKPVRYDGRVTDEDRGLAIKAFQDGDASVFVSNPTVGGEGITLTTARTVIYYNTSYKLTDRLQSEDRAHRIGQTNPVNYIDLVAEDTVDEDIVDALIKKQEVAAVVLGDTLKGWLSHE